MYRYSSQLGVSLIELVVVILLIGLLVAGSSNLLYQGFTSFFVTKDIINANWQASVAMERITRDLRSIILSDISTAEANLLVFANSDNQSVSYRVIDGQLKRGDQVIAGSVRNITFSYYDQDSLLLVPPLHLSQLLDLRYVVITLIMKYDKLTHPVTTTVYLWNAK